MKALTTFRRLVARCCFCPFEVLIVSRSEAASSSSGEVLEEVADRLGAHAAREVLAEAVGRAEPVLELAEDLLVVDDLLRGELPEGVPGLVQPGLRVLARVAGVTAPRLDVEVHLADLQRPLDERVEILLLDLPVRPQAEVVRLLADLVRRAELGQRLEQLAEEAVAEVPCLLEILGVDARDELCVVALELAAREQRLLDLLDVLGDRALLGAGRLARVLEQLPEGLLHLDRGSRDLLELTVREPAVVTDRGAANELADLLRVLGRDLVGDVDEHAADEPAGVLERRDALLLGPVVQAADPELVVLVEVALLALGEVLAAALEAVLERCERLLAVDVDPLVLGVDLVLEVVQVLLPCLVVHRRDDGGGEVEDLLELARSDVEQVADPARDTLEEPDVRDRRGQVDVAHALAAHLLPRDLYTTALADDALVANALVLAAVALPVLRRTEDALAEEAVALGLERAVVDRLGLGDLARGPVTDLLARGEPDPDGVEFVDVDQSDVCLSVLSWGIPRAVRLLL